MKVKKHHQLKNNSVTTLSGVRPLGTLFVFFFVSCFPAYAVPFQETTTSKTFADWCLNKNKESVETLQTINALLQVANTTDCNQASKLLSALTELSLDDNQIADLKPLSTLTNLTILSLDDNQADVQCRVSNRWTRDTNPQIMQRNRGFRVLRNIKNQLPNLNPP